MQEEQHDETSRRRDNGVPFVAGAFSRSVADCVSRVPPGGCPDKVWFGGNAVPGAAGCAPARPRCGCRLASAHLKYVM
jgi:hypothetical protein